MLSKIVSLKLQIYMFSFSFSVGLIVSLLLAVLNFKKVWCFKIKKLNKVDQTNSVVNDLTTNVPVTDSSLNEYIYSLENTEALKHLKSKYEKALQEKLAKSDDSRTISRNDDNLSNRSSK